MTGVKIIKRRIRSAKNIQQITKAMEMVSASKMRRSQEKALTARPYSTKLHEILTQLARQISAERHPMLRQIESRSGSIGVVLIAPDRGLCGSLATNLFHAVDGFKTELGHKRPEEVLIFEYIVVGKKARDYVLKSGQRLHADFTNVPERPKFEDILPISRIAIDGFASAKFKEIYVLYTTFVTTLKQEVSAVRLLPIEAAKLQAAERGKEQETSDYIFEPDADYVLEDLLPHYIEMLLFHMILEAQASEHSARMVAMRNASDNAAEIIAELTLIFNKHRQQAITSELADMITARQAVKT